MFVCYSIKIIFAAAKFQNSILTVYFQNTIEYVRLFSLDFRCHRCKDNLSVIKNFVMDYLPMCILCIFNLTLNVLTVDTCIYLHDKNGWVMKCSGITQVCFLYVKEKDGHYSRILLRIWLILTLNFFMDLNILVS